MWEGFGRSLTVEFRTSIEVLNPYLHCNEGCVRNIGNKGLLACTLWPDCNARVLMGS
jgi:hypothetical protein